MLDTLLLSSLLTVLLMAGLGKQRYAGWLAVIAYSIQMGLVIGLGAQLNVTPTITSQLSMTFFDHTLVWQLSGLGWFFILITVGAAWFAAFYAASDWGKTQVHLSGQHLALSVNVLAMLLLLTSGDFLSLFIGWELVSWTSYFMMAHNGGKSAQAAYRYILYAMAGAMAILVAIALIYNETQSITFAAFWQALPEFSALQIVSLVLLFGSGFLIKLGTMPFHLWQAEAYAETPGANAAFLGAISSRMGLFAFLLVFLQPLGIERLAEVAVPFTFFNMQTLLAWVAALTMIIPTFIALQQSDARLLLTWHGIGQGGFMLLGVVVATDLGVTGGLLHAFNYATYQAALFLAVTAVVYRTGTADLDRLGGLIVRMPWTYITLLMGIIGLAGLPPMNGFVSKWIIYKSVLEAQMPLLLIAASISTLGTILSVYKLIHNIFLGQLRKEHYGIKEVPWTMLVPMLGLAGLGFITGVMPGLALEWVDKAQIALGYQPVAHHLGGVELASGGLNMLWVFGIFMYGLLIGAIIFFLGNRRYITHQWDNYAGGHFLSAEVRYHYSHNFYPGVMRVIGPWFIAGFTAIERGITNSIQVLSSAFHGFYRASYTPIYLLAAAVLALIGWLI
jgi:formate hydrogenlyase subunit 3/multisubunit Na+/H+ antiporter MnhD subunit